jgi:hypothetical protein
MPVHRQERRNAQRYQERRERPEKLAGSGRRVLRELMDASAAGRLRRAEEPLRQAEQPRALQAETQRRAERAMALAARRP